MVRLFDGYVPRMVETYRAVWGRQRLRAVDQGMERETPDEANHCQRGAPFGGVLAGCQRRSFVS